MYKCPICSKEYEDPVKMAECIIRCNNKKKEDEERARIETLNKEEESSWKTVEALYDAYRKAKNKHYEKYSDYYVPLEDNSDTVSKLLKFWGFR